MIHPSSVIDPQAQIDPSADIGPLCYVGPKVKIGANTRLVSHVSVLGRTTLGSHNTLWPGVVAGADPQDLKFKGEDSELIVGSHNDLRECVTLHLGTANGGNVTRVGDHNLIMAYSHIGHDCVIDNHVILANAVQLAGHIHVQDHANVGGASAIHHYVTVGQFAFVGGMTRVVHDVPPYMLVEGNPAVIRAVNAVGLKRHRFDEQTIERLKLAFRRLYRASDNGSGEGGRVGNLRTQLDELEKQFAGDRHVAALIAFTRQSMQGAFGRFRESQRQDDRFKNPVR